MTPPPAAREHIATGRPDRVIRPLSAVVVLFVLLAILKPWGGRDHEAAIATPAPSTPLEQAAASAASPVAVAAAEPSAGPGQIPCSGVGWEVVSLDRLADWTVRTWQPALPIAANGPLDPAIPDLALDSPRVLGLGSCRPGAASADAEASGATVEPIGAVWRLARGRAVLVPIEPLVATGAAATPRGLAALYRPSASPAMWSPGRYVLELRTGGPDPTGPRYVAILVPPTG
jgi:hypothetical protein